MENIKAPPGKRELQLFIGNRFQGNAICGHIFVQFDKAVLTDGQEVILNAGIQALAVGAVAPAPTEADTPKSIEATPHGVPVDHGSAGSAATSDTLVVSTIYEATHSAVRPPLGTKPLVVEGELTSDGLFTPDSKGVFGRPDLKIYTPTSEGSHGTVLLSSKKYMRVDRGTRLLLVVQPPPAPDSDGVVHRNQK